MEVTLLSEKYLSIYFVPSTLLKFCSVCVKTSHYFQDLEVYFEDLIFFNKFIFKMWMTISYFGNNKNQVTAFPM